MTELVWPLTKHKGLVRFLNTDHHLPEEKKEESIRISPISFASKPRSHSSLLRHPYCILNPVETLSVWPLFFLPFRSIHSLPLLFLSRLLVQLRLALQARKHKRHIQDGFHPPKRVGSVQTRVDGVQLAIQTTDRVSYRSFFPCLLFCRLLVLNLDSSLQNSNLAKYGPQVSEKGDRFLNSVLTGTLAPPFFSVAFSNTQTAQTYIQERAKICFPEMHLKMPDVPLPGKFWCASVQAHTSLAPACTLATLLPFGCRRSLDLSDAVHDNNKIKFLS